jgi:hypothetical protein
VSVATPANPALRTIAIGREESASPATAGRGTRTGEVPAAALHDELAGEAPVETLRKETPTTVGPPTDALREPGPTVKAIRLRIVRLIR